MFDTLSDKLQSTLSGLVSELKNGGEPEARIGPLHNLYAGDPDMFDRSRSRIASGRGRPSWAG